MSYPPHIDGPLIGNVLAERLELVVENFALWCINVKPRHADLELNNKLKAQVGGVWKVLKLFK